MSGPKTLAMLVAAIAVARLGDAAGPDQTPPRVFLLDGEQLAATRAQLRAGDKQLESALKALREQADRALSAGPYSVVNKEILPPTGDKHDYMSLAPYWWPNPETADGLPYVRRDGERNPGIYKVRNRLELGELVEAVETLAMAYYFTGDEKYADRAALLIKTWFLEPATRMNPNLRFGQAVRGINEGRGAGLIETRMFTRIVDALGLLSGSTAWTDDDQHAFAQWLAEFLRWMQTSDLGREESSADNNHGTYYDVQVATYALFLADEELARDTLAAATEKRIAAQIEPDGRQPLELERTKAWSYSTGNLAGLMTLARLGEHAGVDLWNFQTEDGRGIRQALDFLAPYGIGDQPWPYEQINGFDPTLVYPLLRKAAAKYPDGPYAAMLTKIPPLDAADPRGLWQSPLEPIKGLHLK